MTDKTCIRYKEKMGTESDISETVFMLTERGTKIPPTQQREIST